MSARSQTRPPTMSRIALGCYPLGGGYGGVSEREAERPSTSALDAGWSFLDTAEAYLDSEERLGRILGGRRDSVFIATKAFPFETYTYEHLSAALDRSLARLQTDRIDLYQLHGPEDWVLRFDDETPLEALAERSLASVTRARCSASASAISTERRSGRSPHGLTIFSTQNLYSLLDRGAEDDSLHLPVERDIIPTAARLGLAFLAFSPLSRGPPRRQPRPAPDVFEPDDERHFLPRFQPDVYPHYVELARRAAVLGGGSRTIVGSAGDRVDSREPRRFLPCSSEQSRRSRSPRSPVPTSGSSGTAELKEIEEIVATLPPRRPGSQDDRLGPLSARRRRPTARPPICE